jgi:hypothetical protein
VHELAADGVIVFFIARNDCVNLARRPRRTSIVQGGTCGRDIGDCDGVWLIHAVRSKQMIRANCAARSV